MKQEQPIIKEVSEKIISISLLDDKKASASRRNSLIIMSIMSFISIVVAIMSLGYGIYFLDKPLDGFYMDIILLFSLMTFGFVVFCCFLSEIIVFVRKLKNAQKNPDTPFFLRKPGSLHGKILYKNKTFGAELPSCPLCQSKMHLKDTKEDKILLICNKIDTHAFYIKKPRIAAFCDTITE